MQIVERLAAGDPEAWHEAFQSLFPVACEAAKSRLSETLQNECEDVAMETLSDILDSGANATSDDELKPLAAAIARNKASDRLRRHLAEKRGGKNVQSLELMVESSGVEPADLDQVELLDQLTVVELRELLTDLSAEVKKEYRIVLRDHFFDQLSYQEIADRRRISLGSVGVYLQRGLSSLRSALARRPKLKAEFLAMLSDAAAVRLVLPILGAVRAGEGFFEGGIWFSLGRRVDESQVSDEQRLQAVSESFAEAPKLGPEQRALLAGRLKAKYPSQHQKWREEQEELRKQAEESGRRWKAKKQGVRVAAWLILAVIASGIFYGLFRLVRFLFLR